MSGHSPNRSDSNADFPPSPHSASTEGCVDGSVEDTGVDGTAPLGSDEPPTCSPPASPVLPPTPPSEFAPSSTPVVQSAGTPAQMEDLYRYPPSYRTISETMARGDGRFDPSENYDDDYDNLYGDFLGNSGGRD